jgi:serine/threonine protein kinase
LLRDKTESSHTALEVIAQQEVVDPFAIDLWPAGVVLFVMLVGLAPFKWAHQSDKQFANMSRGGLEDLMDTLDIPLSPEVIDLLQGFFWSNPRRWLTLAEAMDHPMFLLLEHARSGFSFPHVLVKAGGRLFFHLFHNREALGIAYSQNIC